jgi:signal transduction histidine kinase
MAEAKGPAKIKKLKLKTEIKGKDFVIYGDAFWLKEVAHSLIDNALKYTPKGEVLASLVKQDGNILFSVKDSGVGLTDEDKENLFKEGGRGKDSLRVNVNSTGYGLFMAKMIIEAHSGRIWAESEGKDKGSIFYMELPGRG